MSKRIIITDKGKKYTLEYTRESVVTLEESGFVMKDADKMAVSSILKLFKGAFLANHPDLSDEEIDKIYARITNRKELHKVLAEMYAEPVKDLFDEPEVNQGNVTWVAN